MGETDNDASYSTKLDQRLRLIDVAYVRDVIAGLEFQMNNRNDIWPSKFDFSCQYCSCDLLKISGYIPYDGVTELELVTFNQIMTITLVLFNLGGLLFGLVCFIFNVIFKNRK